ncbi:hypothetical protein MKX03_003304, partial [Papaver bracteatum]
TQGSSYESGEEADYENSYDCNTDSDSECFTLIEKFDSLFGDNCFYKIEDSEGQPHDLTHGIEEKNGIDYVKSQAASSSATSLADSNMLKAENMATKNMDDEARCRENHQKLHGIEEKNGIEEINGIDYVNSQATSSSATSLEDSHMLK